MKHQFLSIYTLFVIFVLFLSACNKDDNDIVETDLELIPYFDMFAEEGLERGLLVDYEAERIEGLLQFINDGNILGKCFQNEVKPRKVIIDINFWNQANEYEKQFLVFHELGHCFLLRGHDNSLDSDGNCVSIMRASVDACDFNFDDSTREAYLDELFNK